MEEIAQEPSATATAVAKGLARARALGSEHKSSFQPDWYWIEQELEQREHDAEGRPLCACMTPLAENEWRCEQCSTDERRAEHARKARSLRQRIRRRVRGWEKNAPIWAGTVIGSPENLRVVKDKRLRDFGARYQPDKNGGILGPSGSAKTTQAVGILDRLATEAFDRCFAEKSDRPANFMAGVKWMKSYDVVRARKLHPLGEDEAPLVTEAMEATLLVIDDLGNEPSDPVMFEVLDHRYDKSQPTLITSGYTIEALRGKYGDALWRRLAERGAVLDLFGGKA